MSNLYKLDYKITTIKDDYFSDAYKAIEKLKKDDFKKEIKLSNYDLEELGIDNFYIASFKTILLNSQLKKIDINKNFYSNICKPLFRKKIIIESNWIILWSWKIWRHKKKYGINPNNNKSFLIGYRFCQNVIFSRNENGIYYSLYESDKIKYLKEKFYPGNDEKVNLIFSQILNYFKTKPEEEGCYVCLCKNWYYHSVPSGFPGNSEIDMTCPKCSKNIGATKSFFWKNIKIVKTEGYYRIFKNAEVIDEIKKKNKI